MFWKAKTGMLLGTIAAAVSIGSIGSVYAADQSQPAAEQSVKNFDHHKEAMGWLKGFKGGHGNHFLKGTPLGENADLLALLKLDSEELHNQLKAGKSLAEIAAAQGVSADAVIQLLTKQQEDQLAAAVKEGKLTQEQADKLKERTAERVKAHVENAHHGRGMGKGFKLGFKENEELLTLLKVDAAKLQEELKAGKSLAEIAAAQGVSADAVIQLLTKQHEEHLEAAVKAGKLTQEQADKRKAELETFVKKMVEHKFKGEFSKKTDADQSS
ncbi:hypothetical protein [Brevibacillus sp. H7]|uniref:hypothetical protein n=1 Tax=Brevibacillus sp. H7 TaxID=3349138 RepID=UPI00382EA269